MKLTSLILLGLTHAFETPMKILCVNDIHLDPMYKSNVYTWLKEPGEHSDFGGPKYKDAWIHFIRNIVQTIMVGMKDLTDNWSKMKSTQV